MGQFYPIYARGDVSEMARRICDMILCMNKRFFLSLAIFLACALALSACVPLSTPAAPAALAAPTELPTAAPTRPPAPALRHPPNPALRPALTPPPAAPVDLLQVRMFDAQNGWALNAAGRVLRTQGGLQAWRDMTPLNVAIPLDQPMRSPVFFLDAQHAWAMFFDPSDAASQGTLWRTVDGGQNWLKTSLPLPGEDMVGATQLFFLNAQAGWLLGQVYPGMHHVYPMLYRTGDGGATWERVYNSAPSSDVPAGPLRGSYSLPEGRAPLTFVDAQHGFMGAYDLFASSDSGASWVKVNLPTPGGLPAMTQPYRYVGVPQFASPQDGALAVRYYEYELVECPPCDLFHGAPQAEFVAFTHDGGANWELKPAPALLGLATLLDGQSALYLGKDNVAPTSAAQLWRTADGGQTWQLLSAAPGLPLGSRLSFWDAQHGLAWNPYSSSTGNPFLEQDASASDAPYLFQTSDGGASWVQVTAMQLP